MSSPGVSCPQAMLCKGVPWYPSLPPSLSLAGAKPQQHHHCGAEISLAREHSPLSSAGSLDHGPCWHRAEAPHAGQSRSRYPWPASGHLAMGGHFGGPILLDGVRKALISLFPGF